MRIYAAAFYQSRKVQAENGGTAYARAAALARPDWCLESYHYITENPDIINTVKKDNRKIFLDSGAFSMFTLGKQVDLRKYAEFIYRNRNTLDVISNLDAIGSKDASPEQAEETARKSYENLKQLEAWLKPQNIVVHPVHHVRDPDHWLEKYLEEGYDYIFIGGMVPETSVYLDQRLDDLWKNYLQNPDKTARVKVHGFGLTTEKLMFKYPWFSVDSTSWVMTAMFGSVLMDLTHHGIQRIVKIDFSEKSSKQNNDNSWHYYRLKPWEKEIIDLKLEEEEAKRIKHPEEEAKMEEVLGFKQGYNVKSLAESYGWRDHWNINYFNRAQSRAVEKSLVDQVTIPWTKHEAEREQDSQAGRRDQGF